MQNKVIIIAVGLLFFVIGCILNFGSFKMLFTGEKVTGTVVGYDYKPQSRNKGGYAVIVSYTTKDKKNITSHSNIYSSRKPYKEDKQVTVYYDKENPSKMKIGTFTEMWMFGSVFMFFGGLVLYLSKSIKRLPNRNF